tara:strand:+ start:215 stop:529 length:315 start_codon:yes stop_codon:yes gene_type:complete
VVVVVVIINQILLPIMVDLAVAAIIILSLRDMDLIQPLPVQLDQGNPNIEMEILKGILVVLELITPNKSAVAVEVPVEQVLVEMAVLMLVVLELEYHLHSILLM